MAHCHGLLQDPKTALENYRRSAAIRETIAAGSPIVQSRLAGTYGYMAGILDNLGDFTQAVMLQRKALEISKELSAADPTNATNREFLDEAYYLTGFYLERAGNYAQALVNYRHALADLQALASADPEEVRTKEYVARCYTSIGIVLVQQGNIPQGLQSILKALSLFQELPPVEITTQFVADVYDAIDSRILGRRRSPVFPSLQESRTGSKRVLLTRSASTCGWNPKTAAGSRHSTLANRIESGTNWRNATPLWPNPVGQLTESILTWLRQKSSSCFGKEVSSSASGCSKCASLPFRTMQRTGVAHMPTR